MKWFILLLILGGGGFLTWHFREDIITKVKSMSAQGGDGDQDDNGGGSSTGGGTNGGGTTTNGGGGNNGSDPYEEQYPMPQFQPLEELVGNWTSVPPSAFPREITLQSDTKFMLAGGAGSTTTKAGQKALALSLAAGQLVLAPRAGSTLRGKIALDQTDFKQVLATVYDGYKQRKRDEVLKQRERARNLAAAAPGGSRNNPSTATDIVPSENMLKEYESRIGTMPTRGKDGRVPLMVNSIQNGDVTEIKLNEIKHWGPIRYEIVEDEPYWTATVNYQTVSLFGTFPTEAMALMRHNKVEAWVYTGSMEIVP